jgi:hypothetical protein
MRSLTPTALSILGRTGGGVEGSITKCAVDPETNDVYATMEASGEGVEVGLVRYEITPEGVQSEVSLNFWTEVWIELTTTGAWLVLVARHQPVPCPSTPGAGGGYSLLLRRPESGHSAIRR